MPRAGRAGELTLSSLGELERDVRELLAAYVAKVTPAADTVATPSTVAAQPSTSALTFAALRELWIERQLSLLHHAKPQATCIEDYTQTLFSIALGACPPLLPCKQASRCLPLPQRPKRPQAYVH
jgi:hypothetical protein